VDECLKILFRSVSWNISDEWALGLPLRYQWLGSVYSPGTIRPEKRLFQTYSDVDTSMRSEYYDANHLTNVDRTCVKA
jgi:hypothetical protein